MDSPQIEVRRLVAEDLKKLRAISRSAVTESVEAPEIAKREILDGVITNLERVSSESIPGVFLTSEIEKEPVGYILIKNYWNLSDLFVSPKHHDKGVGRALWGAALPICEQFSERSSIRVNSSLNAVAFYESIGFRKISVTAELPDWVVPLERQFEASD